MDVSPEIERLSAHFAGASSVFTTSPLYQSFCPAVAHDPPILRLLTLRRTGQQPSYLLFGAVHYLLLGGVQHPLRDFYPSLVERAADPRDAPPFLLEFCRAHRGELGQLIRSRLVQTNVVRRASGLLVMLWAVRRRCEQPVHLIEVGASAGIHLHFDRYRYVIGGRVFGRQDSTVTIDTQWRGQEPPPDLDDMPLIRSRTGIDLNPVEVADPAERLWLRALVWPEDHCEAELLTAALQSVASDPPVMIAGDAIDVCPELGRRLPAGEPRVVFHTATRMHVPAERRAAFDAAIDSVGDTGPLYHAWMEPPSAQHHGLPPAEPGALAMHGPGDDGPVALAPVSGHLEWAGPLSAAEQPPTRIRDAGRA